MTDLTFDGDNIFSDIDWDEGSDNPFGLDPGTYEVTISNAVIERSANGNLGLWLTFSNDGGKSIRKWATLPEKSQDPETRKRNTSFLRLLMKNLELPQERWANLEPADFEGMDCVITVAPQKNNPEYNQVTKITRSKGTPVAGLNPEFRHDTIPTDGGGGDF